MPTGVNPAQLDLVSGLNGTGALLSVGGQTSFNQGWNQQFDTTFTNNAPYASVSVDVGDLNIDASVRHEIFRGTGWAQGSTGVTVGNTAVTTDRSANCKQPHPDAGDCPRPNLRL